MSAAAAEAREAADAAEQQAQAALYTAFLANQNLFCRNSCLYKPHKHRPAKLTEQENQLAAAVAKAQQQQQAAARRAELKYSLIRKNRLAAAVWLRQYKAGSIIENDGSLYPGLVCKDVGENWFVMVFSEEGWEWGQSVWKKVSVEMNR
jgi:hypothetical protein